MGSIPHNIKTADDLLQTPEPDFSAGGYLVTLSDITDICPEDGLFAKAEKPGATLEVTPYPEGSPLEPSVKLHVDLSCHSMAELVSMLDSLAGQTVEAYDAIKSEMTFDHPGWSYPD